MTLSRKKAFELLVLSILLVSACGRKPLPPPPSTAAAPPTPAPAAAAPTITLRAQPPTIERGSATTLQWEARNAAAVTITPEIGTVALTGNRSVSPASSVSYTATATGPGGTTTDVVRITVNAPPPPPAQPEPPRRPDVTTGSLFDQIQDVLFEYDRADIRSDMVPILQSNANLLKNNSGVRFTIEGHCDERGSEEYNFGLGDRRANAVKEFLITQGVPASRINTVSYGEERPACRDQSEQCLGKNRRAHFAETR